MRKPTAKPAAKPVESDAVTDARGMTRVITDVPRRVGEEFAILAIRRGMSKRALMAKLIMDAVTGK